MIASVYQLSIYCRICQGTGKYRRIRNGKVIEIKCPLCGGDGKDHARGKIPIEQNR